MKKEDLTTFDPRSDFAVFERGLPHWSQAGTVCFVTWRLADSLPREVLSRLDGEIRSVLRSERLGWDNWKLELAKRAPAERVKVQRKLFQTRDKYLDKGYGECWLARVECGKVVLDALLHFDEQRYYLCDAVIMPNHVHFLCAFAEPDAMLKQCEDWKRYTARRINKLVNRSGTVWQTDQFDHLVRSPEQFGSSRKYVAENPQKAGLADGMYLHFSKGL